MPVSSTMPTFVWTVGPGQTQQPAPFSAKGRGDSKAGTLPLWPTGVQRKALVSGGAAESRL